MLDQKIFGEKLRNHRKKLGMTQEEVAEKVGVSPQAISKWEAGDCLPDCFNLKTISDVYKISADVLLETESSGDLDAVSSKIEQLATEFVWSMANYDRYKIFFAKSLARIFGKCGKESILLKSAIVIGKSKVKSKEISELTAHSERKFGMIKALLV